MLVINIPGKLSVDVQRVYACLNFGVIIRFSNIRNSAATGRLLLLAKIYVHGIGINFTCLLRTLKSPMSVDDNIASSIVFKSSCVTVQSYETEFCLRFCWPYTEATPTSARTTDILIKFYRCWLHNGKHNEISDRPRRKQTFNWGCE